MYNLYGRHMARAGLALAGASSVFAGISFAQEPKFQLQYDLVEAKKEIPLSQIPARSDSLANLKSGKVFDVLVIGGGVTGLGISLDGALRGLDVACVERGDFASGTSSRSTKLIHGGVRYLEKAFKKLDYGQLELVKDALRERKHLIHVAPHLSSPLPIIVPLYHSYPIIFFTAPYYWAGVKAYDFFAGSEGLLEPSYWISRREATEKFPMLKKEGLKGGVVYYDGQHNDSRMCLAIGMTAAAQGASLANHVEVVSLTRAEEGNAESPINGAVVRDNFTGEQWTIKAKTVVNATGPFSDGIRTMANKDIVPIIAPSSGVHLTLSGQYSPKGMGLIVPNTRDGRVLFLLPWEGSTIAGTTDSSTDITSLPRPHEEEITWILREVSEYLNHTVRREDVDAAWSGIRPLARDPNSKDTASISRDHVIEKTAPGLWTIAGGKWTTYRKMGQDVVDALVTEGKDLLDLDNREKPVGPCESEKFQLVGAAGWSLQLPTNLHRLGVEKEIADHLSHNYGDKSYRVVEIARKEGLNDRLAFGYPYIEAEVVYGARHEYACTAIDVLSNRTRLAFVNTESAKIALPRVINLLAAEFGWDTKRRLQEYQQASEFIRTMNRRGRTKHIVGAADRDALKQSEARVRTLFGYEAITEKQIQELKTAFDKVDSNKNSRISKAHLYEILDQVYFFGVRGKKLASKPADSYPENVRNFLAELDAISVLEAQSSESDGLQQHVTWDDFIFATANHFGAKK